MYVGAGVEDGVVYSAAVVGGGGSDGGGVLCVDVVALRRRLVATRSDHRSASSLLASFQLEITRLQTRPLGAL